MDKEIKRYIAAVGRRLNLPGKVKKRCLSDLQTTITARLEGGESWEQIRSSLGEPAVVAAELNEQMKEFARRKSPWRFAFLAAAVVAGVRLLADVLILFFDYLLVHQTQSEAASIGIIGGADGPTAIFLTAPDWMHTAFRLLVLIVGIVGFILLRRCRIKK